MGFVQIIELSTTRMPEIEAALDEWLTSTSGRRSAQRGVLTQDLDKADTYIQVVEFPSRQDAMANSALPETAIFAERLSSLCTTPPTFRNLAVLRDETM